GVPQLAKFVSIHVPKCGGASLRTTFKRSLGERFMPDYGNKIVGGDLHSIRLRRLRQTRRHNDLDPQNDTILIHGHFNASKYLNAPFEKVWITFVREPTN